VTATDNDYSGDSAPFVGRHRELARIEAVLERRLPALLIVSGENGRGKTRLVQEVRVRAIARGWSTIPHDGAAFTVDDDTTETGFLATLSRLLRPDEPDRLDRPLPASLRTSEQPSIFDELRQRAPVLVTIDGYRPSADFAQWFVTTLVARARHGEGPVVIIVADRAPNVTELTAVADDVVTLEGLDDGSVREIFASLASRLFPPMETTELNAYVEEVCHRPDLLGALTKVLQLALPAAR
jgi:hypothetical protein